jgi:hypothetical protein
MTYARRDTPLDLVNRIRYHLAFAFCDSFLRDAVFLKRAHENN